MANPLFRSHSYLANRRFCCWRVHHLNSHHGNNGVVGQGHRRWPNIIIQAWNNAVLQSTVCHVMAFLTNTAICPCFNKREKNRIGGKKIKERKTDGEMEFCFIQQMNSSLLYWMPVVIDYDLCMLRLWKEDFWEKLRPCDQHYGTDTRYRTSRAATWWNVECERKKHEESQENDARPCMWLQHERRQRHDWLVKEVGVSVGD